MGASALRERGLTAIGLGLLVVCGRGWNEEELM